MSRDVSSKRRRPRRCAARMRSAPVQSADLLFGSARYRKATLDGAREFFQLAGVPEEQAKLFIDAILKEYPYPTVKELFLEQIDSPLMAMVLGADRAG
jgi:hypothetical protein